MIIYPWSNLTKLYKPAKEASCIIRNSVQAWIVYEVASRKPIIYFNVICVSCIARQKRITTCDVTKIIPSHAVYGCVIWRPWLQLSSAQAGNNLAIMVQLEGVGRVCGFRLRSRYIKWSIYHLEVLLCDFYSGTGTHVARYPLWIMSNQKSWISKTPTNNQV